MRLEPCGEPFTLSPLSVPCAVHTSDDAHLRFDLPFASIKAEAVLVRWEHGKRQKLRKQLRCTVCRLHNKTGLMYDRRLISGYGGSTERPGRCGFYSTAGKCFASPAARTGPYSQCFHKPCIWGSRSFCAT